MNLLEVEDLHKTYPGGRRALVGVRLHIAPGERVVLLGRNGAGKSTLIRCVLGLVLPDRGHIRVAGVDALGTPAAAQRLAGVVFEEADNAYAYLTVLDNVRYFGLLNGWDPATARERAHALLERVGLAGRAGDLAQSLSRGLRQKLALAIALTKQAPLLLLDEPTLGLDIESQHAMRAFLTTHSGHWQGLLVTTHDVAFAHAVGTRFLVLDRGRIVWEGDREQVRDPSHLEALFLAAVGAAGGGGRGAP